VWADVTIKEVISRKAGSQNAKTERTTVVKGLAMWVEARRGNDRQTTVYDAATGRITVMNAGKRRAEIYEAPVVAAAVERKLPSERVTAELAATGRSQEMLGVMCNEYTFVIMAPIGPTSQVLFSLRGSAWIAQDGPGRDEYMAFARAAEKAKFVFGDFESTRAVLALVRGQTELYRRIAALGGMPYAIDLAFKFEGTGAAISLVNKMASGTFFTASTAIGTDPISEEVFAVPAGWKTITKQPGARS
jgi:hypothetical protein